MSLITQCPACATMFKVVPDQLRISDGWVRCGQCDEVFDANAHLYADPEAQPPLVPASPERTLPADSAWVSSLKFDTQDEVDVPPSVPNVEDVDSESSADVSAQEIDIDLASALPEADFAADEELDRVMNLSPGQPPGGVLPSAATPPVPEPVTPVPRYAQVQVKTVAGVDTHKLSFMRKAGKKSLWRHGVVRACLGLVLLVLTATLALQVVILERDQIAATEPASHELLAALCEVVGCQIQPLRKIDAVVIDSSSFSKVRGDMYRLNFTFKSMSTLPLAVPALELTLTDMQDHAVLRRVVSAKDLSTSKTMLQPGAELSVVLPLRVTVGNGDERISGYRLLAFYP
jgi:predicted Zn finger-like uncharacterized protein